MQALNFPAVNFCLTHQLPEDQMSPLGLVCAVCKARLYANPPLGTPMAFWESQPEVYTLDGEPCFAFTFLWQDFRIRSLHPNDSLGELRSATSWSQGVG